MLRTTLAALIALSPTLAFAEVLNGVYRTEANEEGNYLEVTFGPCDSNASLTCGVITRAVDGQGATSDYEHLGRTIVADMEGDGSEWSDGTIWAPDDDKTYNSNMELNGTTLTVEGCVFFICRGQDWEAVN
jgi:uncharacterized protein (DUF2147 family)